MSILFAFCGVWSGFCGCEQVVDDSDLFHDAIGDMVEWKGAGREQSSNRARSIDHFGIAHVNKKNRHRRLQEVEEWTCNWDNPSTYTLKEGTKSFKLGLVVESHFLEHFGKS